MHLRSIAHVLAATALAVVVLGSASPVPAADATTTVKGTALALLARVRSAPEHPAGYARSAFVIWIDADHDGCDTRREVLIAESTTRTRVGAHCAISGGTWRSAYDGKTTRNASAFDIDHLVPLKEAWDSGAWRWTAARRKAYANDLGDARTLRAVSASTNRSKADRDLAQWLPPAVSFRCTYVTEWVAVKVRWGLTADAAERAAAKRILSGCPARTVTVSLAP